LTFKRALFWLLGAVVIVLTILIAVANREMVVFRLTPLPVELELPLYAVVFACLLIGLLMGWLFAAVSHFCRKRKAKAMAAESSR
jgi:uncharacterized integral membrane protein